MFIHSNVHMHSNCSSSKFSSDCLHTGMYELYTIAMLPLDLHNLQVHLHSACANIYYCL